MQKIHEVRKAVVGAITGAATKIAADGELDVSAEGLVQLVISAAAVGFLVWVVPNADAPQH